MTTLHDHCLWVHIYLEPFSPRLPSPSLGSVRRQSVCQSVSWSVGQSVNWWAGWSVGQLVGQLVGCSVFLLDHCPFFSFSFWISRSSPSGHDFRYGSDGSVSNTSACSEIFFLFRSLRGRSSVTPRQVSGLLGQMESMSALLPLARPRKRPLLRCLSLRWDQSGQPWDFPIPMGPWFVQAVSPWLDQEWLISSVLIVIPAPSYEIYTDSSLLGWGAHLDSNFSKGFGIPSIALFTSTFWSFLR